MSEIKIYEWQNVKKYRLDKNFLLFISNDETSLLNIKIYLKTIFKENFNIPLQNMFDFPSEGEKKIKLDKYLQDITQQDCQGSLVFLNKKVFFLSNIIENTQNTKSSYKTLNDFVEKVKKSKNYFIIFHYEDTLSYTFIFNKNKNPLYDFFRTKGYIFTLSLPNYLFDFVDAFLSKDLKKSFHFWRELKKHGESEKKILSLLIKNLRFILQLKTFKDSTLKRKIENSIFSQHPFVQKKISNASYNFSIEEILKVLEKCYECYIFLSPTQDDIIGYDSEMIFSKFLLESIGKCQKL